MPSSLDDDIKGYYTKQSMLSAGSAAGVSPINATTALQVAPKVGVAPVTAMHNPTEVVQQAQTQDNHTILQSSPSLQSWAASDPTKAAAIGDSYKPLADLGFWAQRWKDLSAPLADYGTKLGAGITAARGSDPRYMDGTLLPRSNDVSGKLADFLGLPQVTAGQAARAEDASVSVFGGGLMAGLNTLVNPVTAPLSRAYANSVTLQPGETREQVAADSNSVLQFVGQFGLGGVAALGRVKVPWYYRGVVNEGTLGETLRLPGPKEFVTDAEFSPVEPPPGGPENPNIPPFVAEQQAASVAEARALVESAPIGQRAPEVVADFLENHTRIGDEVVWVPPQTLLNNYFADKTTLGHSYDQLIAAQDAGEHLPVPLSTYLAETAGKPDALMLDRVVRYSQDGLSLEEYKQQQEVDAALADNFLKQQQGSPIPALASMTKVGEKLQGSNPGGVYEDEYGAKFLVKGSHHETLKAERAINEAQANALYAAVTGQQNLVHLVDLGNEHGGGLGVASRLLTGGKPFDVANPLQVGLLRSNYALHAWLANRDVVGLDFDNVLVHGSGIKPIDLGGALRFRGMGELKKDFGPIPLELEGFKNPAIAAQAAQVFSGMSKEEETYSAENIQYMSPEAIRKAITLDNSVPFDKDLYDTLIARQKNILARYNLTYPFSEQTVLQVADGNASTLFEELFPEGTDPDNFPEPEDLGYLLSPEEEAEWEKAKPEIKAAIVKAADELFLTKLFEDNKALGMNKKTFQLFSDKVQKEFMQKAAKLWKKTLDNIRKERGREWRAAYAVNQLEVENLVLGEPGIKASHLLRYSNKGEDPLRKDNAFVDAKGNPITFYHAAWHNDIGITADELALKKTEFERKHPGIQADFAPNPWKTINYDVISFTTNPEFANNWKKRDYIIGQTPGRDRTIYVTYLKAARPGDFRNPADVEKALQWYIDKGLVYNKALMRSQLEKGEYSRWENPKMWADCGFDAAYVLEDPSQAADKPNACVANPEQIHFKYEIRPGVEAPSYKLSLEVKKLYPKALWEHLPNIMFSATEGKDADFIAAALDLDSGEALLSSLTNVELARGKVPFRKFVGDLIKQGTMEKTKADIGDVASPEAILAEAKALFSEPDITELLEDRLKLVAKALSLTGEQTAFSSSDVKAIALKNWESKTVADAGNTQQLEKQLTRMGKKGQEALLRGNLIEAFKSWQEQLIAKYQITEAYKLQKEFKRMDKTLARWGKADVINGVDPAVSALIQQALAKLHYRVKRDPAELERFLADPAVNKGLTDISTLIQFMNAMGTPVLEYTIPENLAKAEGEILPQMTVSEFRNYTNMLKAMVTFGREEQKIVVAGKSYTLDQYRSMVMQNAAKLGEKYTTQQLHDRALNAFGKGKHLVKSVLVGNLRPEVFLHWLDGNKHGPLMRGVVDPLMDGKFTEADLVDSWVKAMQEVDKKHTIFSTANQAVSPPPFMDYVDPYGGRTRVIQTRGNLRVALAYLGTESGRERLLEGFGWGAEQEAWILSQITESDKAFVEAYWDENEKLFPKADQMYMRLRGYGLEKQEPREIVFPDGTKLKGGYIHVQYSSALRLTSKVTQSPEGVGAKVTGEPSVLDYSPVTSLPSSGFTKARTNVAGPLDLNVESMARGVSETIHDISYREPLINAQKVLTDPVIADMMQRTLGPEYQAQVMPWLKYIASTSMFVDPTLGEAVRFIRRVTSNIVFTKLALNPNAALKHSGIGFGHMLNEVKDPVLLTQCLGEVVEAGPKGDELRDFISANSGEVRTLLWNTQRSISEGLTEDAFTGGAVKEWRKMGYVIFTMAKLVESRATWLARYRQEVNRTGDTALATVIANKAVRDTQGAGSVVDTPTLLRRTDTFLGALADGVYQPLMGFRNTAPNRFFTMVRLVDSGVRKLGEGGGGSGLPPVPPAGAIGAAPEPSAWDDFGKAGSIASAYILIPALFITLLSIYVRGDHEKGKDPEEALLGKFIQALGEQTLGSLSVISWIYATFEAALEHFDGQSMLQGSITDMVKVANMPEDRMAVAAVKAFGAPFGLIPDSLANAAQYGIYAAEGKLQPQDKTVAGFGQTVLLGRKPDVEKISKRNKKHNVRSHW